VRNNTWGVLLGVWPTGGVIAKGSPQRVFHTHRPTRHIFTANFQGEATGRPHNRLHGKEKRGGGAIVKKKNRQFVVYGVYGAFKRRLSMKFG